MILKKICMVIATEQKSGSTVNISRDIFRLEPMRDKEVRVLTNWKEIRGKLVGWDKFCNIVLDDACMLNTAEEEPEMLGLVLLKASRISSIVLESSIVKA